MKRANKGSDPARSYRCIFIDAGGNLSCQLDIMAADFDHIERWANEVIERSADDVTGGEIWCNGERIALLGTAIAAQSEHNGRSGPPLLTAVQRDPRFGAREL